MMDTDEGYDDGGGSVVLSLPAINDKPLSSLPAEQDTVIPVVQTDRPPIYTRGEDEENQPRAQTTSGGRRAHRFPRIVLRDPVGRELATDTLYQRTIYEARWRTAHRTAESGPPGPDEWRLPRGPLPARPDYSRQPAKLFTPRKSKKKSAVSESVPTYLSDTVEPEISGFPEGFAFRSLDVHTLASLGLLKQYNGKRIPSRRYMPFTGVAVIHDKLTSSVDKREREYAHPAFCTGCQRSGFCYGCEKQDGFHIHQDKKSRTGGGFTYYKRDNPLHQIPARHPLNWRGVSLPLAAFYDDETLAELQTLGVEIPSTEEGDRDAATVAKASSLMGVEGVPTMLTFEGLRGPTSMTDLLIEQYEQEYSEYPPAARVPPASRTGLDAELSGLDADRISRGYSDAMTLGDLRDASSLEQDTERSFQDEEEEKATKKKLYKAPKAFQLKAREKKFTKTGSPFSENRDLNIPKYKEFEIKKSDKETTKFIDMERDDTGWQEPAKFELKDREHVPMEPWSPPKRKTEVPEKKARTPPPPPPLPPPPPKAPVRVPTSPPKKETPPSLPTPPPAKEPTPPIPTPPRSPSVDSGVESVPTAQAVEVLPSAPLSLPETRVQTPIQVPTPVPSVPVATIATPPKERTPTPKQKVEPDPIKVPTPEPPKKKKEPPVKKEKKEPPAKKTRKLTPPKLPTPKPPTPQKEVTPEPTPEPPREPTPPPPPRPIEPPPLPSVFAPEAPPLPDYMEPEKPKREVSRTLIEVPPPMAEPPKQRRPPPPSKPRRKYVEYKRKRRIPVAPPAVKKEPKQMADPLDYLAKYCIIHPDRMPHYERVFRKMVDQQAYRYSDVPDLRLQAQIALGDTGNDVDMEEARQKEAESAAVANNKPWLQKAQFSDHERRMMREMSLLTRTATKDNLTTGMGPGDEVVAKLTYTLDNMLDKYDRLNQKQEDMQEERKRLIASKARAQFPQIKDPNYTPTKKAKKKKKKKKDDDKEVKFMEESSMDVAPARQYGPPTDKQILERMDDDMLAQISSDPEISKLDLELSRVQEKLKEVDDRIEELEDEKKLMQIYSRDEYHYMQTADVKPSEYMRRQSTLYNKLNQCPDVELNISDVEEALQQINGHLVSEKEYQFIYHILDLPARRKINLKMFSVVAALSEKVAQVDPLIKKIINKLDYEALSVKMERSRELFMLLNETDIDLPDGKVKTNSLAVELAAGGVTQEHVQYVVNKFTRNHCGSVDFLEFLTYVPLFIEIHQRIIKDPLNESRDL